MYGASVDEGVYCALLSANAVVAWLAPVGTCISTRQCVQDCRTFKTAGHLRLQDF